MNGESGTRIIDLRSDTVTRPTRAMRKAMATALVGDDVYGEDPTVNRLERLAADLLGMEAGLFAASGTQTNLLALLTHCGRGDEYICGQEAHCYRYEGGGAAVLGGIQPQPLDFEPDGTLDLSRVSCAVKPDDYHCAPTRLVCLENTQAGKVLPLPYLEKARRLTRDLGLALHLDGARFFNATVKLGIEPPELARHFDSVSLCLSKGLGAPVGSVLCGPGDFIARARRWRKVLGGGMRQAGVIAAAGIVALEENISRLSEDHHTARFLAIGLAGIQELRLDPETVQTNMVFLTPGGRDLLPLTEFLRERGILVGGRDALRLVTHMDVTTADVERVVEAFRQYFA